MYFVHLSSHGRWALGRACRAEAHDTPDSRRPMHFYSRESEVAWSEKDRKRQLPSRACSRTRKVDGADEG